MLIVFDLVIIVYLFFAMTSWNKPSEDPLVCTKVEINIEDENENGFLKTGEVKALLEKKHIYPLNQRTDDIDTREIENVLLKTAFVKTAQCYVTDEGHVCISLTQRTPIVRVKADNGEDYYIDDNGGVMPNSQYTADMPIVTGRLTQQYACRYISVLASVIMADDLWRNQVEQINVLADKTIEIVPRVGDHIINIGSLPSNRYPEKRKELVTEYVKNQLHRIELFYKYGLSQAGWNKYSYISLEFANQVICTNRNGHANVEPIPIAVAPAPAPQPAVDNAENKSDPTAAQQKKPDEKKPEQQAQQADKKKTEQKPKSDDKKQDVAKKSDEKKKSDTKTTKPDQKTKKDNKDSKDKKKKQ